MAKTGHLAGDACRPPVPACRLYLQVCGPNILINSAADQDSCPSCRADYPVRRVQDGQKRDVWVQMHEGTMARHDGRSDEPAVQSM